MKRTFLTSTFFALALMSGYSTYAQSDTTKDTYHESVIVVGDYNPVLDGVTEKVNVAPTINDSHDADLQPKFTYSITPRRISSLTATSGIKAAKVIGSPTRLYNNYMRFGLGHDFANFLDFNPMMDLYYTSTRNDNMAYGARLFHESDVTTFGHKDETTPSPDYYGRNRQADTKLDLFGKYILNKQHLFSAQLLFDRQYGRYYGFSDSTLFANTGNTHDDISFSDYAYAYNNLALNLGAKSLNTDVNKLGYEANIGLADMWAKRDFKQLSMELDGSVHYGFPMFRKYKAIAYLHTNWQGYSQKQQTGAPATIFMPSIPTDSTAGRHLLTINPYVDFLFKDFKIHAGLAFGFNGYDDPEGTTHDLFPDISVAKAFMNNRMSLTVGFQGGYTANDWNSLRIHNPYLEPAPYTFATVDDNLYAHLRINFSKKLTLNVNADNHFFKNQVYYRLTDPTVAPLGNTFTPYYIDHDELDLATEFTFVNDEMITLNLGFEYCLTYNTAVDVPLYHSPDYTAHLGADINYLDKWFFEIKTFLVGKVDAYYSGTNYNLVIGQLPARFAILLGAEYIYNRALSFFAQLDNVTFQRHFLWANYPAQRFNAIIGLTYTIPTKKN